MEITQKEKGATGTTADILALRDIELIPEKAEVVGSDLSPSIGAGEATPLPVNAAQGDIPAQQSDDEIIRQLASLKPLEYFRVRTEKAAALKVGVGVLDKLVKAERADEIEADKLPFVEVEPNPDPIDPAQLLDEILAAIRQFVVLDPEQAVAAALWVTLTWFIDVVEYAPLAIINAPEKSCGKTLLLDVLGRMAYRPLPAANASPSALFRAVDLWKPTILIDEADTFFQDKTDLHGMVNAGYRRGGSVLRSVPVGDTFEPRSFPVFSAKALAGIALEKHLPDTTMSRGIVFNLRRKLSHESVSRLRHADRDLFTAIAKKLARFALDYSQQVEAARSALPDALSDRDQDNWDGLLALASCAGDEWLARAIAAAMKLSGVGAKMASTSNELLADIQHVFENKQIEKISTADLIAELCNDEEAAWSTYNKGKPITPRQVARQLAAYGIASKTIRLSAYETAKGFELAQFEDAFKRYLTPPPENANFAVTPSQVNKHAPSDVTDKKNVTVKQSPNVTPKAVTTKCCDSVADKTQILGGTEASRPNVSHLRI